MSRMRWLKWFILLHFGVSRQCRKRFVVQCNKIPLTGVPRLPRMKLLRRTISRVAALAETP